MKTLLLPIALFIQVNVFSQLPSRIPGIPISDRDYDGMLGNLYLINTGIARSEAMGKTTVSEGNSAAYALFNPALLGTVKNYEVQYGFMQPLNLDHPGKYLNVLLAGRISNRLVCSASYVRLEHEKMFEHNFETFTSIEVLPADDRMNLTADYTLINASSHKLDAGFGLNHSRYYYSDSVSYGGFHFDVGLLYRFTPDSVNKISFGVSGNNLTNQKIKYKGSRENQEAFGQMPQTLRFGMSYTITPPLPLVEKKYKPIQATFTIELNELINSQSFTMWKGGFELKVVEIICLRAGHFDGDWAMIRDGFIYPEYTEFEQFTFGLGLEIPFRKLISPQIPLLFGVDFARLSRYSGNAAGIGQPNGGPTYNLFNMRLAMDLNK
ncbi:MAG: hypothetical protein ACKVOK_02515 [Flavobacteriales bacterium]